MLPNHTALPFLFTLLAFVLTSLLGAAAAFAQPACEPEGFTDSDSIAAAMDVDDDNDGLIEICDLNGLDHVRHNLAGTSYKASETATEVTTGCPGDVCKGYELTEDLDFNAAGAMGYDPAWTAGDGGTGWPPIGGAINCVFEGNSHVIKNLYINDSSGDYLGLFSGIESSGEIRNLGLTGSSMSVLGSSNVGTLVGGTRGLVTNCYSTGPVTGTMNRTDNIGGLIGIVGAGAKVFNCYTTGTVNGRGGNNIGGLAGGNHGMMSNCYTTGNVEGTGNVRGGLVGRYGGGSLSNCYATGDVTGSGNWRGRLVGYGAHSTLSVSNCYATGALTGPGNNVRPLVGQTLGSVFNSYWENMGAETSEDTKDRTSAQLKSLPVAGATDLYDVWSTDDWDFGDATQYPALKSKDLDGNGDRIEGYVLCGQPGQGDTVPLRDACYSVISVEASADGIEGGSTPAFVITKRGNDPDGAAVDVTVTLSQTGDFVVIPGTAPVVRLPAGPWAEATLAVALTADDDLDEADGTVTATISIPAGGDRKVASAPHNSATVAVADDDLPLVSIAGGAPVVEGEGAVFTVSREGLTTAALSVKVTVGGDAGFLPSPVSVEVDGSAVSAITGEAASFMVMIAAGATEVNFTAASAGDGLDEADGTIEATVTAVDGSYRVDDTDSASVNVTDNDLPEVSITAGPSPVTEGPGAVASFTVSRPAWDVSGALVVDFTVDQGGGDFIEDNPVPFSIEIGDGAVSEVLTFQVDDDVVNEADGMITVTLSSKTSVYTLSNSAFVAMVEVADDDLPMVSIAGGAPVVEGEAAVFTVTRVGDITAALSVKVTVGGDAGFLPSPVSVEVGGSALPAIAGGAGSFMVMIAAGATEVNFTAASAGDDVDEADGSITVTVTAVDGSYRVDAADPPVLTTASASVNVTDDDLPSITSFKIGENSGRIDEDADPKTITVTVAEGTLLVSVTPTVVTVRSNATLNPSGAVTFVDGTAQDYTVTVGDETITYKVTVNVVAGTPPGVPGDFSAVAGVEKVTLSWTAPTELGSTGTLSRYEYQQTRGTDVSPWEAVEPSTALTQVVGSLMAGEVYGFEVRAVGSTGLAGDATAKEEATPLAVGALMFMGTVADQTYMKDTAITPLTLPVATGGTGPYTYTLAPVPAGLMFDAVTRRLSGMPTAVATTTHTYTVTDSTTTLTVAQTFTITVNAEGSPTFADTVSDQTYTENTEITPLTLPVATGGMGPYTYTLAPVPAGLMFDAVTRRLSGMPTAVATTTHTYTVTDTATTLTAAQTFTITVSDAETTFGIGSQGTAVHVYPNPAGDVLHIEFPSADEYGIALLTLTGQPVLGERHAGGGSQILDLSSLSKGVYFLKIEDSEGVSHTFRIIR